MENNQIPQFQGPGGAVAPGLRSLSVSTPRRIAEVSEPMPLHASAALAVATVPNAIAVPAGMSSNAFAMTGVDARILFRLSGQDLADAKKACHDAWTDGIKRAQAALASALQKANAIADQVARAAARTQAKSDYQDALAANDEAYALNKAMYGK